MFNIRSLTEKLVGKRFKNKNDLEEYLKNKIENFNSISEVDDSGLVSDYAFICDIGEYCYLDIYYLKVPFGEMEIYITETNLEI